MISKNDCLLLLADIADDGININEMRNKLFANKSIDMEVIKFINIIII